MLTFKNVYYGKIFIKEEYDTILAEYGVIVLGPYNKKLKCYEKCLCSGIVYEKLKKLTEDKILSFEGTVVNSLENLTEKLNDDLK